MFKRKHTYTLLFLLLALISFNSCAPYLKHYTAAQDYFNEAATLDNELKLKVSDENFDLLSPESQVQIKYLTALNAIEKVLRGNANTLRQDGLLASAYTIKALSEWKTKRYDASIATAREGLTAIKQASDVGQKATPRDEAVLRAIPGLIRADQAAALVEASADQRNYENIASTIQSGLSDIDAAIEQAPKGNPVRKYLYTVKLAMLETWLVASADLKGDAGREASQKIMKMQKEVREMVKE